MTAITSRQLESFGITYSYSDLATTDRREKAASTWALVRAVNRFLDAERWRLEALLRAAEPEVDNVARLDTHRGPVAVPVPEWYLDKASSGN